MKEFASKCLVYGSMRDALKSEEGMLDRLRLGAAQFDMSIWMSGEESLVVPRSVLGRSSFTKAVYAVGWPVEPRQTGGGVTPQGPGILNVSLGARFPHNLRPSFEDSYELICGPLISELASLGISATTTSVDGAFCDGRFNVVVGGKKLAGTAQRRLYANDTVRSLIVFVHALVLVDVGIDDLIHRVNRFNAALGSKETFAVEKHVCLRELLPESSRAGSLECLSQRLARRYHLSLSTHHDLGVELEVEELVRQADVQ